MATITAPMMPAITPLQIGRRPNRCHSSPLFLAWFPRSTHESVYEKKEKASALWTPKLPEWLALNSSVHIPL